MAIVFGTSQSLQSWWTQEALCVARVMAEKWHRLTPWLQPLRCDVGFGTQPYRYGTNSLGAFSLFVTLLSSMIALSGRRQSGRDYLNAFPSPTAAPLGLLRRSGNTLSAQSSTSRTPGT